MITIPVIDSGNVYSLNSSQIGRSSILCDTENRDNPIRESELVASGALSTKSYILFHNELLREDILLTVGGTDFAYEWYLAGITQ